MNGFHRAERKQVTVLFCDVVDYTLRSSSLDPEDLADQIQVFHALCRHASKKYHGQIISHAGDSILVLFGHPYASEYDAEHAARTGIEIIEQIHHNNASERWQSLRLAPIQIRIAIATGLVFIIEHSQDKFIFGETPNLAARLQAIAKPNTILSSFRTKRLLGRTFKFRNLGKHRIKGFPEPISVWQVLQERTYPNHSSIVFKRAATRFIGRHVELKYLLEHYEKFLAGQCRIIHLSGDPGIGKSRLIQTFEKTIHKKNLYRVRIVCSHYFCHTPFKPIIDEIHCWLKVSQQYDLKTQCEKICNAMQAIGFENTDEHALLAELLNIPMPAGRSYLDIDAKAKHHRSVDTLAQFVIRALQLRSFFLIVEDLQWADSSTLEVLTRIITWAQMEQLFTIFSSRSDFIPPWKPAASLVDIHLNELDENESKKLIAAVLGAHSLPDTTTQKLLRKSNGVPLFLEETSRHAIEQIRFNALRKPHDIYHNYGLSVVPDTLQDLLNARLDQLGEAKAFAQLVAVFGDEFRYSIIDKIALKNGIDVESGMKALLHAKLISVIPSNTKGVEDRYRFCQVLFRDAAYSSLPINVGGRKHYHLQIAELLREENPDIEQQHPALIAEHYSHTDHIDVAVGLWLRAAEQALAKPAIHESFEPLSRGLSLVKKLLDDKHRKYFELALLLNHGTALAFASGYYNNSVTHTYESALAVAETSGNYQQTWAAQFGLWRCLVAKAKFSRAVLVATKLKSTSKKPYDAELLTVAYGVQGTMRMMAGDLVAAATFYHKAVRLHDRWHNPSIGFRFKQNSYAWIRGLGAINQLIHNNLETSIKEIDRSIKVARATQHAYIVTETLCMAAMFQQIAGNADALGRLAKEAVTLSTSYSFKGLLVVGNIFLVFYQLCKHRESAQVENLRNNIKIYEKKHGKLFLPYFYGLLAQAYIHLDDYLAAVQSTEQALEMVDKFGEQWWHASLLGIRADAGMRGGGPATSSEIAEWLQTGIQIAKNQHASFVCTNLKEIALRHRNCDFQL